MHGHANESRSTINMSMRKEKGAAHIGKGGKERQVNDREEITSAKNSINRGIGPPMTANLYSAKSLENQQHYALIKMSPRPTLCVCRYV